MTEGDFRGLGHNYFKAPDDGSVARTETSRACHTTDFFFDFLTLTLWVFSLFLIAWAFLGSSYLCLVLGFVLLLTFVF